MTSREQNYKKWAKEHPKEYRDDLENLLSEGGRLTNEEWDTLYPGERKKKSFWSF